MKAVLAFALALFLNPALSRAAIEFPVTGRFYMQVDDSVEIWRNGSKFHAGKIGASESGVLALAPGDRLVIRLWNKGGPRGFKLLFVSNDRKTAIQFKPGMFRILRDPDKKDLTPKEFAALTDPAKPHKRAQGDRLIFKNSAPWFWGATTKGDCYVATVITKEMFEVFNP